MSQSSNDSQNPYVSPRAPHAVAEKSSNWRRTLAALLGVMLPCLLAWAFLEAPTFMGRPQEPESSVKTPNPAKAPFPFVTRTQEIMVFTNIRLAIFAQQWSYLVYGAFILWPMLAPPLFSRGNYEPTGGRPRRGRALFSVSLLIGMILAWPWLAVIFIPSWLGP